MFERHIILITAVQWLGNIGLVYTVVQRQTEVSAYLNSEHLPLFAWEWQGRSIERHCFMSEIVAGSNT